MCFPPMWARSSPLRQCTRAFSKSWARAEDCLFVDDLERNLRGAMAAGMRAVQMARTPAVETWDGPVVHDFAELETYAESIC